MTTCTPTQLPMPVRYVPGSFPEDVPPPADYQGTVFDFEVVQNMIEADGDNRLIILGTPIDVQNLQLETPVEDPDYPIYFEVTGCLHHYVVSIWLDKVTVEVCNSDNYLPASIMWPATEAQLRRTLQTIVADHLYMQAC